MSSIEKSARTVDAAIDLALEELGLERDKVEVDILQLESNGVLGLFGKKQGRVRVTPIRKGGAPEPNREDSQGDRPAGNRQRKRPPRRKNGEGNEGRETREGRGKPSSRQKPAPSPKQRRQAEGASRSQAADTSEERRVARKEPIPDGELVAFAGEVIQKISSSFGIDVEVGGKETDNAVNLRVVGDGVGQLIGRRGRTLGAVQFMVSRLINEDRENRKKISIDVDGYSEDREDALRDMAERAAERVAQSKRPQSLRPMSPPERRMAHLTLQDHPDVATESFGDEGSRCVVVYPRGMDQEELAGFVKTEIDSNSRGRRPRGRRGRGRGPRNSGTRPQS